MRWPISPVKPLLKPLRILFVEDSDDDVLLMVRELEQADYDPAFDRVDTAPALRIALEHGRWDIVIADYTMPRFSAPEALGILKERGLDLPCIVISGTMNEAIVVATMRFGACDYLLKGNLARLVPAIERELREAKNRERRRREQGVQLDRDSYLQAIFDHMAVGLVTFDERGIIESLNYTALGIFGHAALDVVGKSFKMLLAGKETRLSGDSLADVLGVTDLHNIAVDVLGRRRDGSAFSMELLTKSMMVHGHTVVIASIRDLTARNRIGLPTTTERAIVPLSHVSTRVLVQLANREPRS